MKRFPIIISIFLFLVGSHLKGQSFSPYTVKKDSLNDEHRYYMGREIAATEETKKRTFNEMFFKKQSWPARFFDQYRLAVVKFGLLAPLSKGMTVAEIGAGLTLPYHAILVKKLQHDGLYIAEDVWPSYEKRMKKNSAKLLFGQRGVHSEVVIGSETSLGKIADSTLDLAWLCDVYHEMKYPVEMLASIKKSLKKEGKLVLIEYLLSSSFVVGEDHCMKAEQLKKELEANGFVLERTVERRYQAMYQFAVSH